MEYRRIRKDRNKFVGISFSEEEKSLIVRAAEQADQSVSDFCRSTLVEAANKVVGE